MITQTLRLAHDIDHWLDRRFGPGYRVLLVVGLVGEMVRQIRELVHATEAHPWWRILPLLLDLALLLHTANALHEHWEQRLARHARRRQGR